MIVCIMNVPYQDLLPMSWIIYIMVQLYHGVSMQWIMYITHYLYHVLFISKVMNIMNHVARPCPSMIFIFSNARCLLVLLGCVSAVE